MKTKIRDYILIQLRKVAIGLLLLFSTNLNAAQEGDSCNDAIPFSSTKPCKVNLTQSNTYMWFSFVADATSKTIEYTKHQNSSGHIHGIGLISGTCNSFTVIDSATSTPSNDSLLVINATNLVVGNTYYIVTKRDVPSCPKCVEGDAEFDLCLKFVIPPYTICGALTGQSYNCCPLSTTSIDTCDLFTVCVGVPIDLAANYTSNVGPQGFNFFSSGPSSNYTFTGTDSNIVTYYVPGTYYVATLLESYSPTDTSAYAYGTIIVLPKIDADFTSYPNPVCLNQEICFTNNTAPPFNDNSYEYWDFGDGTGQSPPCNLANCDCHTYSSIGTYNVTLIMAGGCPDTVTHSIIVSPPELEIKSDTVCYNSETSFFIDLICIDSSSIVSWNWNFGDGTTQAGIGSIISNTHTYPNTGSFNATLTVSDNLGNNYTDNLTVIVNPLPPIPVIMGVNNNCLQTGNVYQITNYDPNNTYSISFVPITIPPTPPIATTTGVNTSGQFTVNWTGAPAGTIVVTATNIYGCKNTGSLTINECCKNPNPAGLTLSDVSLSSLGLPPSFSNVNVYINGTLTIDVSVGIFDSHLNFGPNAKIVITNGASANIARSVLKAGCGIMWDGVYIDGSTNSTLAMRSDTTLDAINGVVSYAKGQYGISNCIFNKNRISIQVLAFGGTHLGSVEASKFSCIPSVYTLPNNFLLPPYNTERSLYGVIVRGSGLVQNDIQIGNPSTPAAQNLFTTGLRIGIRVERANVKVYNCRFNDISEQKIGKAIWAVSQIPSFANGLNTFKLIVGGTATNEACDFNDCTYAVFTDTCMRSDIIKNKVDRTSAGGLAIASGFSINNITAGFLQTVNIKDNTIKNMDAAVICNRNTRCQTNIRENDIGNTWYATSSANKTGIAVTDINSTNGLYFIYNNDIDKVQIGVNLKSVNKAIVEGNRINVRNGVLFFGARGVFVVANSQTQIKNNQIKAIPAASTNINVLGVYIQNSPNSVVRCNDIQNIGGCIRFDGPANITNTSSVYQNSMQNGKYGIWLNNSAVIGPQGTAPSGSGVGGTTSDNIWQPNSWSTNRLYSSNNLNGNLSKFYYRTTLNKFYPLTPGTDGFSLAMQTQGLSSPTNNPTVCVYPAGGGDHRMMQLLAKDSMDLSTQELKWLAKHAMYRELINDTITYANDTILQRFKDSLQYENTGKLERVLKSVGDSYDIVGAQTVNASLSTYTAVESNFKTVNQLLLDQQMVATVFDSTQLYVLRSIATMCPYTDGSAVYLARALVYPYDRPGTEYENECELFVPYRAFEENEPTIEEEKITAVYPNPASNEFFVEYKINEKENASIIIYDVAGSKVMEEKLNCNNNKQQINTSKLNAGVYLYKIIVNGEAIIADKLVIIK